MLQVALKALLVSLDGLLELLLEHVLRHVHLGVSLDYPVLLLLFLQLFLDLEESILEDDVVVLGGCLQRLIYDTLDHFFVALNLELAEGDT